MNLNRFNPECYAKNYCAIQGIKYDKNKIEVIYHFVEDYQKIKYNGIEIKSE